MPRSQTRGSNIGAFIRGWCNGSAHWLINNAYTNSTGLHVPTTCSYHSYYADNTNVPAPNTSVSDAAIQNQIKAAIAAGKLIYPNPFQVFVVFSDTKVNLGGGFGSQYCAYHGRFPYNGKAIIYAVMPYNADFPFGCSTTGNGTEPTPNNDYPADKEVNTLSHEIEEAATDPLLNAWYDASGQENADKCVWTFGTTFNPGNGSQANVTFGSPSQNWLIQRNWALTPTQQCSLS